jgi:ubiquinone/menaquinone biosynthesis C-methylase UbiE
VTELRLVPDELLVDLGCGRGGYGLEVARRTGARLLGVDFSSVAIMQAAARAAELAHPGARLQVGELTATGLTSGAVDAVMCIDAVQFGEPTPAVLRECRRILKPGGAQVLATFDALRRVRATATAPPPAPPPPPH